jgi:hypothetical protein
MDFGAQSWIPIAKKTVQVYECLALFPPSLVSVFVS